MPWNQCESVRPLAVESGKADRLLGYGDACCGYSTGNDVIDGLMPGYFTRGLLIIIIINIIVIRYAQISVTPINNVAGALYTVSIRPVRVD